MESVSIVGMGSYLPRTMHTNATLPALDTPATPGDYEKIGVNRRGWAAEDETIPQMAYAAAERALARAQMSAKALDVIVLANWTQRRYIPDFAPKVQDMLGATKAFAFDVSGACTGFAYGVSIAHGFLQNPRFSRALVVASETTSKRARPGSKATLIFGDAAGAWVLERGSPRGGRLIDYELITDGSQYHIMDIDEAGHVRTHIKQKELNALAARIFADASSRVLTRNNLTLKDVDWIVPHSGTAGVQATLLETLDVPPEKVLTNFASIGNVSSAAIPVALDEFVTSGKIRPGDLVLSPAPGTGWFGAALLYRV